MAPKKSRLAVISVYSVIFAVIVLFASPFLAVSLDIIKWDLPIDVLRSLTRLQLFLPVIGYLLGILFGCAARISIKKSGGHLGGKAEADKGVRIGTVLLVINLIGLLWLLPALEKGWGAARRNVSMQNVRALVQMFHFYSIDHGGYFPPSFTTLGEAGYEIGNLTSCPVSGGYGLNIAAKFESPTEVPLIGDYRSKQFNGEGGNIGYVDGSVRGYRGSYSAGSGPLENVSPEDWVRQ